MKLKKKVKRTLILLLVIIIIALAALIYFNVNGKKEVKEAKIVNEIKEYGYTLKDNKPKRYKKMFEELKGILEKDKVDEEAYLNKITEMYIYDFYSLKDKVAKTDVGGVEFIKKEAVDNYLQNAQNTYYKYVESNIYGNRKQSLPVVSTIEVKNTEKKPYAINRETDENAYYVDVEWSYTDSEFRDYQKQGTLVFIHEGKKLCLVELNKDEEQ